MFALSIVDSDLFLEMPVSARCLYYDLSMRADDDGFVNPKKVIRLTNASEDDLKVLTAKRFVIPFETGVVVIKDWKIHNYIRKDTYNETLYKNEKALLDEDSNSAYTIRQLPVDGASTQVRLGKVRLGKDRIEENTTPAVLKLNTVTSFLNHLEEVRSDAKAKYPDKNVDRALEDFIGYIESRHTKYKDFKLAFFNWVRRDAFNQYKSTGITQSGAVRADTSKYKGK